eukprot:CAMPEP_0184682836 /NCGR_PEP_ID=MMETSP0312-20130426/8965_1 /TAXON_ID=31354 /ORGANISM="Compsopogon coeruleus, Strain SAG 36.94" /LENGTH=308 /DNA_ID=CAMNT_0027134773 /DNA_START=6 /DNA_END=932 /DNA_ORIENTATION=+
METWFDHLPDDLVVKVLGLVGSVRQILQCRMVCRRFRRLIEAPRSRVWENASFEGMRFEPGVEIGRKGVSEIGDGCQRSWKGVVGRSQEKRRRVTSAFKFAKGEDGIQGIHKRRAWGRPGQTAKFATHGQPLFLTKPRGEIFVRHCARAGNQHARMILGIVFEQRSLRAVTFEPHQASRIARGEITAFDVHIQLLPRLVNGDSDPGDESEEAGSPHEDTDDEWLMIHAARSPAQGCVHGGVVGLVRVRPHHSHVRTHDGPSQWSYFLNFEVLATIPLQRPILCAGFRGIWTTSQNLCESVVRAICTSS